jgi:hypothetical protein
MKLRRRRREDIDREEVEEERGGTGRI